MKIAVLHGPRDLRIEDQELPSALKPDEVRVKTIISAFKIGTDRGNYEGADHVPGAPLYPRWVGDSNLGRVVEVGDNVTRVQIGDRVVSNLPHQSEYIAPGSEVLVKVPESVHNEDAVYAFLYGLSSHCYRKAFFQPGEYVAVVGLGVLGLGAVGVGPNIGARVVAIGNSEIRLEMARKMGAHAAFLYNDPDLNAKLDEFTGGAGIDLVVETANPWPALRTAMEIVRPNGRVAVVALTGRGEEPPEFNPLHMSWFYIKGISLIAVSGEAGDLFVRDSDQKLVTRQRRAEFVLDLMATGKLEPKRLITHRIHYSNMVEAYEMAFYREKSMLGVIFQWEDA